MTKSELKGCAHDFFKGMAIGAAAYVIYSFAEGFVKGCKIGLEEVNKIKEAQNNG